jgi:uncharacterized cupin superfamily protein
LPEVAAIPVGSDVAMSPSSYVTAETLKEGDPADSFTLTKGWRGEYRVTDPLVKQFAIYVP